ncbi:hypothetical protein [Chryseobacterium sp. W4I1]|uniref:hypothetical protein n=1 Tax=Chryseobacterium sp. W4I1 TaxID=3042293 RepID=UPI002781B459|nr:hypothetical protein [Chryseobacterium sp. W4I1]MDQ0781009.1 hypothetical protein [Chryseobacterium sp. W4I1]
MNKRLFEKKVVFYLAVVVSFLLLLFSFTAVISTFNNFTVLKLLFTSLSLILNLFAFINLLEKYNRAILFLNISLCLFIILSGMAALTEILAHGFSRGYGSCRYALLFIAVLIIFNKYKVKKGKSENEIEEIGKHND